MASYDVGSHVNAGDASEESEEQNTVEELSIVPLEKDSFGEYF